MQTEWPLDESDDSFPTQLAAKRAAPINSRVQLAAHKCHVIVVYSLSGGTGKTTIATNVAAALKRNDERVLVIDCALQSGDVGVFLNLQTQYTICDLANNIDNVDLEALNSVLENHDSGIQILLAPRTPQDAETIQPQNIIQLIEKLRPYFDFIVIDTASQIDELWIGLSAIADYVLHVINSTLPCIKNTRTALNLMDAFHYAPSKSQLVMNRVNVTLEKARIAISVAAIENNLKRKALGVIPLDERKVHAAINRGMDFISREKDTSPAKELIELADALYMLCKGAEVS